MPPPAIPTSGNNNNNNNPSPAVSSSSAAAAAAAGGTAGTTASRAGAGAGGDLLNISTASSQQQQQPISLPRSISNAISHIHSKVNKVFAAPSPSSKSAELLAARAAIQSLLADPFIPSHRPLPSPLRHALSTAINPQLQNCAKKCHATEHYSILLDLLHQLAPLVSDHAIVLEWWDFLLKPVLRDINSSQSSLQQASALVLTAMSNTPQTAYQDVPAPNTPWPTIDGGSVGNFARKVGDAPYSTFASGPAPTSSSRSDTLSPPSSFDSRYHHHAPNVSPSSPIILTTESSAATFRRRVPPQQNTLYRFTQRIVQLYFAEVGSVPYVKSKRSRTRDSSGTSQPTSITTNTTSSSSSSSAAPTATNVVGDHSVDSLKLKDLSGLGLTGIGSDERLPTGNGNAKEAGMQNNDDDDDGLEEQDVQQEEEEEDNHHQHSEESLCWSQRLETLVLAYGRQNPKRFFHHLSFCFAEPTYRIPVLVNLIAFISSHPSSAYHLIATPLPAEVLMSLQIDTSTTVISLGVRLMVMIMPHIPMWFANGGGGGLPALMAVFARIIDWRIFGNGWEERVSQPAESEDGGGGGRDGDDEGGDRGGGDADDSEAGESTLNVDPTTPGGEPSSLGTGAGVSAASLRDEIINRKAALDIEWMELDRIGKRLSLRPEVQWSRLTSKYDGPDTAAPDSVLLFSYLYGLFPANVIRFLRAPIDYLRKAHYLSPSAAAFEDLIDELTIHERCGDIVRRHRLHEGLVTHSAEWEVCNPDRWKKLATEEIAAVCINHYLGTTDGVPGSFSGGGGGSASANLAARLTERLMMAPPTRSGTQTPTANPDGLSPDAISSAAMKPTLSAATLLTPALSISSTKAMSTVHRENLMLRTELNYELNLKGQLLHFIGKLHRDKLQSHRLAAEQQNLKSEVKVLRAELEHSRKERDKIRDEADKRAKRLGNPQQRLRQYMEKDKRTTEELQKLMVELQSKEETNEALSTQLESLGTELFELKALWNQNEPGLRELEGLRSQVGQMQELMKSWADNEARYDAQAKEMSRMARQWAQLELERDCAQAMAQEAMQARDEAELEKQGWIASATETAAQLNSLREKWAIKPPTLTHAAAGGGGGGSAGTHSREHHSLTPTSHIHASGAVLSALSPTGSPLLQAVDRSGSRRQSAAQGGAASRMLFLGGHSGAAAASAMVNENGRLTAAVEEMQVEILELRAQLALLKAGEHRGSDADDATERRPGGGGSNATTSRRAASGLEDVDVMPLDIGPAKAISQEEEEEKGEDVEQRVNGQTSPVDAAPAIPSSLLNHGVGGAYPDYIFTTIRVLGGSVDDAGSTADPVSVTERLLPSSLRSRYAEQARQSPKTDSAILQAQENAEVVKRVPLLGSHLERLLKGRRAMRETWSEEWRVHELSLSDEQLEAHILAAIRRQLQDPTAAAATATATAAALGDGAGHKDLRMRVEVNPWDDVKVSAVAIAPLSPDGSATAGDEEASDGRLKVRLDTESIELFPLLLHDDDDDHASTDTLRAMATCKSNKREAYQAAARRLNARYGVASSSSSGPEEEGQQQQQLSPCFDGLLWTRIGSSADEAGEENTPERRLLTESTIANVIVEVGSEGHDTKLVTPKLRTEAPLVLFLPGLLRNELVRVGLVEERDIPVDLISGLLSGAGGEEVVRVWLCNALRGMFEVQLVA
ncbi:hypothetical protein OC846_004991 [Tilletia horrida]|uniref:Uncharacterized protein n=1 Tax=Tilletia horrida TaxID=155126 RepID=A0AAN6GRD7_9BASI|nr:hypothetical protein OC846_004991 [Tilletia horrida]